jgi:hypothetical protein
MQAEQCSTHPPLFTRSDTAATTLHLHSLWKPRDNATVSLAVTLPHTLQQAAGPCQQTCNPRVCHPTTNKQTPSSLCVSVQPTSFTLLHWSVCRANHILPSRPNIPRARRGSKHPPQVRAQALRPSFYMLMAQGPCSSPARTHACCAHSPYMLCGHNPTHRAIKCAMPSPFLRATASPHVQGRNTMLYLCHLRPAGLAVQPSQTTNVLLAVDDQQCCCPFCGAYE